MSGTKRGFTLIEMLVVIGIIAVLSGALMMGFGRITKSAQRAKATELVSQAAQALVILHHTDGTWPSAVINFGGGDGDGTADKGMVKDVAEVLAQYNLLSVACKDRAKKDYTPIGVSRCGVVDPWAESRSTFVPRRLPGARGQTGRLRSTRSVAVPTTSTVGTRRRRRDR